MLTAADWELLLSPHSLTLFWAKVDNDGPIQPHMTTQCHVWTGCVGRKGYGNLGRMGADGRVKHLKAHRFAFEITHGPLPPGQQACHHCDYPPCVRDSHLFAGTNAANQRDAVAKGRSGMQRHPERCRHLGEHHGMAVLTDEKVRWIRAQYAAGGVSMYVLAAAVGACHSTVWHVLHRKTWTHVKELP